MPDGTTMYVKGNISSLGVAEDQSVVTIAGPAIVTGFGAGKGTFEAIFTPDIQNKTVKELVLTTDVNGGGTQGNMPDGSEGPFKEKLLKSSLEITP
jgi:hypothetical protein